MRYLSPSQVQCTPNSYNNAGTDVGILYVN
jgi:hypothetical protein